MTLDNIVFGLFIVLALVMLATGKGG